MEEYKKLTYEEVYRIVKESNPKIITPNQKGTGFWLFNDNIEKDPYSYLTETSRWKPIYYGLFTDNKCTAMICYTFNYRDTFRKYPYVLTIQNIGKKGDGVKLLHHLMNILKKEGYEGIALRALTDFHKEFYKKLGFTMYDDNRLEYTFKNNELLKESYTSGAYGDPTYSTGTPNTSYNSGYMYSVKSLNANLSGHKQNANNIQYIHIGSMVSGINKDGNRVTGRVYRIVKDSNGYIKKVWIFGKNAKLINISLDGIYLLNSNNEFLDALKESFSLSKAIILNEVKNSGNLTKIALKGKKYILTLNEGDVVIGELNKNNELISLNRVLSIDESFAKEIAEKINS